MRREHPTDHVWLPGLRFKGGIQAYSAAFLEAFVELRPGLRHEVFLKNDAEPEVPEKTAVARVHAFGRWPGRTRTFAFAARAAERALVARPRLVVAGHLHFAALARHLSRIAGIPYWVLTHGVEAWAVESPARRRALREAGRVLSVSRYTADRLIREQGLDPGRVSLLPNTFDPGTFTPRDKPPELLRRYQLEPDQPVLLTVARLAGPDRAKGYDLVLDALPRIREEVPDTRYVLVGDGPDRRRVAARVRDLGLEEAVTVAGFVPDEELPDHYNLCDVFAMPGRKEGFGIVYLEALGCGKPVVAGDRDGSRDALLGGELGVLADPADPVGLAATIVRILRGEHPNRILYDPAALRRRVIEAYGPRRFRARLAEILALP